MLLIAKHRDELADGPFGPLLGGSPVSNFNISNPDDEHFSKLNGMLSSCLPSSSAPLLPSQSAIPSYQFLSQDAEKMKSCEEALKELRKALVLTHPPYQIQYSEAALRVWTGSISQDFVDMIHERDPRALVILAYYCVLLKKHNHVWYLRGLGTGLLENIRHVLGIEWQHWIQWAIEQPAS